MKFCEHCGNEVLDDAVICPKCGCSVNNGSIMAQPQGQMPNYGEDTYSGLSIAGFILSFLGGLLGLILSIVAYNEAKKVGSQKSMTLSKAGIIISAVLMGLGVLISIISFVIMLAMLGAAADGGYLALALALI